MKNLKKYYYQKYNEIKTTFCILKKTNPSIIYENIEKHTSKGKKDSYLTIN
jgi:hypothetical protein